MQFSTTTISTNMNIANGERVTLRGKKIEILHFYGYVIAMVTIILNCYNIIVHEKGD